MLQYRFPSPSRGVRITWNAGNRGFAPTNYLLILVGFGAVMALAFVGFVVLRGNPDPIVEPAKKSIENGPFNSGAIEMPDRTRAIEELSGDSQEIDSSEEEPMGPTEGWTLVETEKSVETAMTTLRAANSDSDPFDIRIAVQRLAEQGNFSIPVIEAALADESNSDFGGGISVIDGKMAIFPNLRIALFEVLRRIDTDQSRTVLSGILSNATDPMEAGYAIWMLENSSTDPEIYERSIGAAAAETLLGSGFAGAHVFEDLVSTRWILTAMKNNPVPSTVAGMAALSRESDNALVRREAEQALAASGTPSAIAAILDLYQGQDEARFKNEKARLLGQVHGQAVLPTLRDHLFDESRPESERSAMVAGIAAINSVVDRGEKLNRLLSSGRRDEFDKQLVDYRADLSGRVELLSQLIDSNGTNNPLGTHATIAHRTPRDLNQKTRRPRRRESGVSMTTPANALSLSIDRQEMVDRFCDYCRIDTQSNEESTSRPSTAKQLDLLRKLEAELHELGVNETRFDERGYLYAHLPENLPAGHPRKGKVPAVGYIAHVDTSPSVTGKNVNPLVHKNYDGTSDIRLPNDPEQIVTPKETPELRDCKGHDIVTTDGTTLLGADNKAGVAEIMTLVAVLTRNPDLLHGPVKVGFTTDEEIGRGAEFFDIEHFGATAAYTIDGSTVGEIEDETFCADTVIVTVHGKNVHPGYAKNLMINAIKLASEFLAKLPPDSLSPETTEGREGYIHPHKLQGEEEKVILSLLIRDFEESGLEEKTPSPAKTGKRGGGESPGLSR